MKEFVIFLISIGSILCTFNSCLYTLDLTNCTENTVEDVPDYTCHAFSFDKIDDEDKEKAFRGEGCIPYPNSEEYQKMVWRIFRGQNREFMSSYYKLVDDDELFPMIGEKEYYEKDEVIYVKEDQISSGDKEKMKGRNTCNYHFMGRYLENPTSNFDLSDPSVCHKVDRFSDLDDLINCGYATINFYNPDGTQKTFRTCFYIPDNKLPSDLNLYYKKSFMETSLINLFILVDEFDEFLNLKSNQKELLNKLKEFQELQQISKIRKLQTMIDLLQNYDLTVEDKFGKKYRYTDSSDYPEIIEEGIQGNQSYGSSSGVYESNSQKSLLNIGLLLSLISLILL